jgi:hypothetical protein
VRRGSPTGHMRLMLAQNQTLEESQHQGKRTNLVSSHRLEITYVIGRSGFKRPLIGEDATAVGMMRDDFFYLSLGGI